MSEQADIEAALARATAAYKNVRAERDALKDANDRAEAAEAENDRLRAEALAEYEYACIERDRLHTDIKQIEAERDRLREALTVIAATGPMLTAEEASDLARAALTKEAGK